MGKYAIIKTGKHYFFIQNMTLKTVKTADVKNKRVILRVDFNVPVENGAVTDDTRIKGSLPTISYLLDNRARVIILSHFGRPDGLIQDEFRLKPVAIRIQELLPNNKVNYFPFCAGENGVKDEVAKLKPGEVLILENIRFCPGEEKNDFKFAKGIASLGDLYVNDAFGAAHRAHASVEGVTHFLPSYAGFLLEKEVNTLSTIMENPPRPFIGIIGGAKISTKLPVIKSLLRKVDYLLLGGALANTILKAQGIQVGKSLIEEKMVKLATELVLTENRLKIPVDIIVANEISESAQTRRRPVAKVGEQEIILDIGPDTVNLYGMIIKEAKTIFWNGPMGYFEIKKFAQGTYDIAKDITESQANSIVGGGETIDAIKEVNLLDKFSYVSTGGGAMLEFLEGKILPGIKPLIKP